MNGIDFPVAKVLDGIAAAIEAGLTPVKINMVVRRGVNESSIVPMAAWARDIGDAALHRIHGRRPLERLAARRGRAGGGADRAAPRRSGRVEPADPNYRGEVADRWRYVDGRGEFGVISSVTQPFCRDCTRARLSAEGKLYTCLFAVQGHDARAVLAAERRTPSSRLHPWRLVGPLGPVLRTCGPRRPRRCRRSRCSRWAAEVARPHSAERAVHRVIHTGPQFRGQRFGVPTADFVDNRVDPGRGVPVT